MKKNDTCVVEITDMSFQGEGIGKADGYTLFVKDAVVGDVACVQITKTKKTYGYARLVSLETPSEFRVKPPCPQHRRCGGCQLQALSYEKQLELKERKVQNDLTRIGGFSDVPLRPIIGMAQPFRYRNKAQYPIGRDKNGNVVAGFYAGRTHTIIDSEDCFLGAAVNADILRAVKDYMRLCNVPPYDELSGKGLVRHVLIRSGNPTDGAHAEILVCLVLNGEALPHAETLIELLKKIPGIVGIAINRNCARTNVILGEQTRTLWGRSSVAASIGDLQFSVSPQSFFQVNPVQTKRLYEKALAYAGLTGEETVWDLYCGIGTISLFLARRAKQVYGVEIVPQAVADAKQNAIAGGITNAEFFVGKAEEVVPRKYAQEGICADVVVVDPPRKGCEETLLATIVKMSPARIIYVSCDPATLARDVRYLAENGYMLQEATPVDMFPMTVHVETVVLMSRVRD